ncbi:2-hydroxyacid dehydrogenase [Nocardiopsis sediminis]|uniref:2-hydroxyacid dehydrogenase n=1 Tax=Nocardiopsis sediminis TaxID=1778267 RepID=A0ABV8FWK1_9ACTN
MKIVIADANLRQCRSELGLALPAGSEVVWADRMADPGLEAAVADADVLVSGRCPAGIAAAGKALKLVHAAGAGVEKIDIGALPSGTVVANTFHHEDSIAEYVVASAILLRRGFLAQDRALRTGEWASPAHDPAVPWPEALSSATVGFIGFGHIGARAWERLRAFGATGLAVTRRGTTDAAAHGLEWAGAIDDLGALLDRSDVVVLSAPLTPQTTGIIGAAELARMGPRSILINVGRGPLVQERALYEALADRGILGAAIDVWYAYPDGGNRAAPSALPFHELPNALLTPHSSGLTRQTFAGRAADIAANIGRLAAGEPLANVVAVAP